MAFDEFDALERAAAATEPDRQGVSPMALWRIETVDAKLEVLGTIEATDIAEAVVKAMAEFNIPEECRNRLIVPENQ